MVQYMLEMILIPGAQRFNKNKNKTFTFRGNFTINIEPNLRTRKGPRSWRFSEIARKNTNGGRFQSEL